MTEKTAVVKLADECKAYVASEVKKLREAGVFSYGVDKDGKRILKDGKPDHAPPPGVVKKLVQQWWNANSGAVEAAFLEDCGFKSAE